LENEEVENISSRRKDVLCKLDLEDRGVILDAKKMAEEIDKYFAKIGNDRIGSTAEAMLYYSGEDCGNT